MRNTTTIKNINGAYLSDKDYVLSEFLNLTENRDNEDYLKTMCLRIIDNIEIHPDNKEAINQMFLNISLNTSRTYVDDLADECESIILDWLLNRKEKMLGTV